MEGTEATSDGESVAGTTLGAAAGGRHGTLKKVILSFKYLHMTSESDFDIRFTFGSSGAQLCTITLHFVTMRYKGRDSTLQLHFTAST